MFCTLTTVNPPSPSLYVYLQTTECLRASEHGNVPAPGFVECRSFLTPLRHLKSRQAPENVCTDVPWKRGPQERGLFKTSENNLREDPSTVSKEPWAAGRAESYSRQFPRDWGCCSDASLDHDWKAEPGPCSRGQGSWSAEPLHLRSRFILFQIRPASLRTSHARGAHGADGTPGRPQGADSRVCIDDSLSRSSL